MAFEIVNETYPTVEGEDPKKYGYIEGYTSNTVGKTYLRINCKEIPDEGSYECHRCSGSIKHYEYKPGQVYGTGVRLNKKQVRRLIWELIKWLVRGW